MSTAFKSKVFDKAGQKKKLGELLVEMGVLTEEALAGAVARAESRRILIGALLLEEGLVTEEVLAQAVAQQNELSFQDLKNLKIAPEVLQGLTEEVAKRYRILPVARSESDGWVFCTDDPRAILANELLKAGLPKPFRLVVGAKSDLERWIEKGYGGGRRAVEELSKKVAASPTTSGQNSIDALLERLIQSALRNQASDIHLDPADGFFRIRERIDGVLVETYRLDAGISAPLTSKLKVLSNLDITEKRKPQDGRFRYTSGALSVDVRISCLPTMRGERVTLRLLNQSKSKVNLEEIGFGPTMVEAIQGILSIPHGIVLVTGPTGSGKTTSVYAMLSYINSIERNIITVEDPVEYQFELVNQVQIQPKSGLGFADVLRNILRQDPDVIMVGEIRDKETAEIAIRAALTGHLVISTIHTNDSFSTISRLIDMGIDPLLISATLSAVLSQRLVRKLCGQCSKEGVPVGCTVCNDSGYQGRMVVGELLVPDLTIKQGITDRVSVAQMAAHMKSQGFKTMWENAQDLLIQKITTLAEIKKVKA